MTYEASGAQERASNPIKIKDAIPSSPALQSVSKRVLDIGLASLMIIMALPAILLICVIIRLDGGPAFFRHSRIGANGRSFRCLKFRTMVCDGERVLAEAFSKDPALEYEWRATQKMVHDPRVTRVGRFLRAFSIDEVPQLFNVLANEMSLVGPRPITSGEIERYGRNIDAYCSVRPGVTGLWQISGRSTTTYERRVALDVRYAEDWSLKYDLVILLKTIPAVLLREGAH